MKRKVLIIVAIMLACIEMARANDGVYFTSGNFLVPIRETDISAAKEMLTITIGKDSFAYVDVYYEFANDGSPKTVTMAFEANSQYNDNEPLNRKGIHPSIKDFTVSMNGERLKCHNSVVAFNGSPISPTDFKPLDMTKWKGFGEVPDSILPMDDAIYNPELDSAVRYAYAYCFNAPFKQGINVVHHTYKYRMSYNVYEKFTIPYWLTPATRWANGKVDDFTLRITAEGSMAEFCLEDSVFKGAPFTSVKGSRIYHLKSDMYKSFVFADMMDGDTVEWHSRDFRPTGDMSINSPWWERSQQMSTSGKVVVEADGHESRYIADCGDSYFVNVQDYSLVKKAGSRIVEYDAAKGKGWIFIAGDSAKRVNVRRAPTTASPIVCRISDTGEGIPDVYPCRGFMLGKDGYFWYKARINGKTGYIRQDLMQWDAINTF